MNEIGYGTRKDSLLPLGKSRTEQSLPYEEGGWRAGIVPMTSSVAKEFVTRNVIRGSQ